MVTTAVILERRRAKKNQKFPVKLRVTFRGKQKYYSVGHDLSPAEFQLVRSFRPKGEFKDLSLKFSGIERKAKLIIDNLENFTFAQFEEKYLEGKVRTRKDVYKLFDETITRLKNNGRIGTAISYENTLHSLKSFVKELHWELVTVDLLYAYERWMINQGKSKTTIGIYLRNLRALYNEAISEKIVDPAKYPFGRNKYQIPTGRNVKKALTKEEVRQLYNYAPLPGTSDQLAKDFWFLSYLLNGINVADIASLRNKDYSGDFIVLERKKTINSTRSNPKTIKIAVTQQAKEIINRHRKLGAVDDYIFSILAKGMTPIEEKKSIQQFIKLVNKWIQRIADNLELGKHVTTYTARHTFATTLKRFGVSTAMISEMLGHSSEKTTQNYLAGFEDEQTLEVANKLVSFL